MASPFYRPLKELNISQPQPATMRLQAMGMADRIRRTDIAEDRGALERESLDWRKKQDIFAMSRDFIPSLTKEEYPKYKDWVKGIHPELAELLPDDVATMPDDEWEEMKEKLTIGTDNMAKKDREEYKVAIEEAQNEREQQQKIEAENRKEAAQIRKENRAVKRKKDDLTTTTRQTKYEQEIMQAIQVAGVDYKKFWNRELTPDEYRKVAETYQELFPSKALSFVEALLTGKVGGESSKVDEEPIISFDAEGNLETTQPDNVEIDESGKTIIRNKIPSQ